MKKLNNKIDYKKLYLKKKKKLKRIKNILKENNIKIINDKLNKITLKDDKLNDDKLNDDKLNNDKLNDDKLNNDKLNKITLKNDKLNDDKLNDDKLNNDKLNNDKLNNDKLNDNKLWDKISANKYIFNKFKRQMEYLLSEFGTKLPCNRFDVGNTIEFILGEFLEKLELNITEFPNKKRIDLCLNNNYDLSIKYSSIGDITLHNSNSCINKDENMYDLLLLTPDCLYLITNKGLLNNNIDIKKYIKNCGDSLKLKRKLLKELKKNNYPYLMNIKLNIDKKKCKNRLCSKIFYYKLKEELKLLDE